MFKKWSCSSQGDVEEEEEEEEEEDSFFCWSFSLTKQSNAVLNMIYFFQVRPVWLLGRTNRTREHFDQIHFHQIHFHQIAQVLPFYLLQFSSGMSLGKLT